jgi:hypothetical protein
VESGAKGRREATARKAILGEVIIGMGVGGRRVWLMVRRLSDHADDATKKRQLAVAQAGVTENEGFICSGVILAKMLRPSSLR